MSNIPSSFGRQAVNLEDIDALLSLEQTYQRADHFAAIDELVGDLISRVLRGQRIATLTRDNLGVTHISIQELSAQQRATLDEIFTIERQQARGAWFLPETASLKSGFINLPAIAESHGRFFDDIVLDERGTVVLADSSDAVLLWSIINPLFSTLFLPFELRSRYAGVKTVEEQKKSWVEVDALIRALGLDVANEYAIMRPGGGWHRLRAADQFNAKRLLLDGLKEQADPALASRYRAFRIKALIANYYKKAKADGRVKRKQALTKVLEQTVAAYFGGNWLGVLDYLGEQPHPDEQVVTALPEPRLFVNTSGKAAEVAAEQGLPVEEVQRILATFWQQTETISPVEQRVSTLTQYWAMFDAIHARQSVGMAPLWGLIEDSVQHFTFDSRDNSPYTPELYRALLPGELISEIERLWGTCMLPRWPERIVTQMYPHSAMGECFGPALQFWHGCALTAWFICEGPLSRTDLPGMEHYYRHELAGLETLGTPVDRALFQELIAAESKLGEWKTTERQPNSVTNVSGITITISISSGSRREGFPILRDIITRHRRLWAERHLNHYLRARWESELREASRDYHQLLSTKGSPPTLKQYARSATKATNNWFGGNIRGLYTAIGEKLTVEPQYDRRLPLDKTALTYSVFRRLGGQLPKGEPKALASKEERDAWILEQQRLRQLSALARGSLTFLQLEEALGRSPTLKEFGVDKFSYAAASISDNAEEAWVRYGEVIQLAIRKPLSVPTRLRQPDPLESTQSVNTVDNSTAISKAIPNQDAAILPERASEDLVLPLQETTTGQRPLAQPQAEPASTANSSPPIPNLSSATVEPPQPKKRSWLDRLLGRNKD